jgi:hypothetical protein
MSWIAKLNAVRERWQMASGKTDRDISSQDITELAKLLETDARLTDGDLALLLRGILDHLGEIKRG